MMSGVAFLKGTRMTASNRSKKNLIFIMGLVFACLLLLCLRLGWIQIVKGEEYTEKAIQQQTRDTPIEAERGAVYDTNGKELAVSVTCYTIWARPGDVQFGDNKKEKAESVDNAVAVLSEALD